MNDCSYGHPLPGLPPDLGELLQAWQDAWDAYFDAVGNRRGAEINSVVPYKLKLEAARAAFTAALLDAMNTGRWVPPRGLLGHD